MATLKDFRDERLRKLADLKTAGFNPYPAKSSRTHNTAIVKSDFDTLENQVVTVAGRIAGIRKFGKLAFIVVRDMSGEVQLFIQAGLLADSNPAENIVGLGDIPLLDTGDFIESTGPVIKTKTGEISVQAQTIRLLTKALRPMPSAQDGFTNKETN